jgi:hypothetical protein
VATGNLDNGNVDGTGSEVAVPIPGSAKRVRIVAHPANAGSIFVGVQGKATDATGGYPLNAGQSLDWEGINSRPYFSGAAGTKLRWIVNTP